MSAQILCGKTAAANVYEALKVEIARFISEQKRAPQLATILVGDDPASKIYVSTKGKKCEELGLIHKDFKFPSSVSSSELISTIKKLNDDPLLDGILLQKPLPKGLDEIEIINHISFKKDVDGLTFTNIGRLSENQKTLIACTPSGVLEILRQNKIDLQGKNALVIGRSSIVGKPMSLLLLHKNCTVTIAHTKTRNLQEHIDKSEIIVCAAGIPKLLSTQYQYKPNTIIIDVGIHRTPDGICGDVDFKALQSMVKAITPVPGGVGPMTIAMLMSNTVQAAFWRCSN